MLKFIYFIFWYITSKLNKKIKPFTVIICIDSTKTFQDLFEKLKFAYRSGARVVRFDGKAFEWGNDGKNFKNIVQAAKKIGYASIAVFWDGQDNIPSNVKNIFIQIDKLWATDKWENFVKNIASTSGKSIYAIYKITKENYNDIEKVLKFVVGNPKIHEIAFTFDETSLNEELKYFIIDKVIEYKKHGFQITNSYRSLVNEKQVNKKYRNYTKIFYFDDHQADVETYSSIMPIIDEQVH